MRNYGEPIMHRFAFSISCRPLYAVVAAKAKSVITQCRSTYQTWIPHEEIPGKCRQTVAVSSATRVPETDVPPPIIMSGTVAHLKGPRDFPGGSFRGG